MSQQWPSQSTNARGPILSSQLIPQKRSAMDTQYKATTTEAVDTMPGIKLLLPCSSPTKPGFDIHADKTGSEPMRKDDLIAGRRKRSYSSATMFVYVGSSDTEPYVVHKTFLGSGSSVLRAMMELEFKEKNEGIIRLRVADHDTFDEYVSFLYTGKLTTTNLEAREEIYNAELHRLIDLYVLGDFLQDPSFSDAVIDRIIANTKISIPDKKGTTSDWQLYPFGKVTSAIYNRVPAGSPLRQLLVDQHLAKGTERWLFDKEVEPPINDSLFEKDFLYDLCLALFSKLSDAAKPKSPETFESTCKYHNHDRFGRTCYKTAK